MKQPYVLGILAALWLACPSHSPAQMSDHLKCYKIKDPAVRKSYTADLGGLVPEPGCLIKVPAKYACVPATKTNVQPPPPGGGGTGSTGAFLCYKVKCVKGTLPTLVANDQFGSRTVSPIVAKLLCAPLDNTPTTTSTTLPPMCGNNVVEGDEECDGAAFASCPACAPTYITGIPACSGTCTVDYSPCTRCDLLDQNCSAGQGCYPTPGDENETVCQTSSQNLGEGALCQNQNDCAPGLACVTTGTGDRCKQMCDRFGGPPSCPAGQTCISVVGFPSDVGICN